jgi:hypothetical protein
MILKSGYRFSDQIMLQEAVMIAPEPSRGKGLHQFR